MQAPVQFQQQVAIRCLGLPRPPSAASQLVHLALVFGELEHDTSANAGLLGNQLEQAALFDRPSGDVG
jgi:hypothetical protein